MGKLQIPRSKTSDRTPFQPVSQPFAPASAVRRSLQDPAAASEAAPQHAALRGYNAQKLQRGTVGAVQAKLTLGPVGDRYEQEADGVARQVMQQTAAPGPAAPGLAVQRQPDLDEEDLMMKPLPGAVQRDAAGLQGGPISGGVEGSIEGARSGGRGLDKDVRASMEPAFGADFSGVRVHADAKADNLNRSLQARAFTTGQDVFFRGGEYNPGSSGGKELLAHELTHVVQQNGPAVMKKPAR